MGQMGLFFFLIRLLILDIRFIFLLNRQPLGFFLSQVTWDWYTWAATRSIFLLNRQPLLGILSQPSDMGLISSCLLERTVMHPATHLHLVHGVPYPHISFRRIKILVRQKESSLLPTVTKSCGIGVSPKTQVVTSYLDCIINSILTYQLQMY